MNTQCKTGSLTEAWVAERITALGLNVRKPVPDRGVDFIVTSPNAPQKELRLQVKGRGKIQQNKKYRWFQIRTTKKQRDEALKAGLSPSEAWRKKVELADIFIFVAEMHQEFWIFHRSEIEELINANRPKHGNRNDNKTGRQAEIDLDVTDSEGIALSAKHKGYLNNWGLITMFFSESAGDVNRTQ